MGVLALSLCVLAAHGWTRAPELRKPLLKLATARAPESKRMEKAFLEEAMRCYRHAASIWVHLSALIVFASTCEWMLSGRCVLGSVHVLVVNAGWVFHHVVSSRILELSQARLQLVSLVNALLMVLFSPEDSSGAYNEALVALRVAGRVAIAMSVVDSRVSITTQGFISCIEVVRGVWQEPGAFNHILLVQLCITVIVCLVSILLDMSTRSRLAALLDSEDLVNSFRQMLGGLCDGELLLDEDFSIIGRADCLRKLFMSRHCFGGFEELLVAEDQPKFRRFMLETLREATPRCLRLSLHHGDQRVKVDLFRVSVTPLWGPACHLLAFREDAEASLQREVPESSPAAAPVPLRPPEAPRQQVLPICQGTEEITLLVDAESPELAVQQAHMSFQELQGPCVKRIVPRTDWISLREQLLSFANAQKELPAGSRQVLKMKLRLQDETQRLKARKVDVTLFPAPKGLKLHLHLSHFQVLRPRKLQGSLPSVDESSELSSDRAT